MGSNSFALALRTVSDKTRKSSLEAESYSDGREEKGKRLNGSTCLLRQVKASTTILDSERLHSLENTFSHRLTVYDAERRIGELS